MTPITDRLRFKKRPVLRVMKRSEGMPGGETDQGDIMMQVTHLSFTGGALCDRWCGISWSFVDNATAVDCRRCRSIARDRGWSIGKTGGPR